MTATTTTRPLRTVTAITLDDLEMTLTMQEWHRLRDVPDDVRIVVPHEAPLVAA